ncbi:MAG: MBL fold metallo-hydrolase [Bifidobacteriaceae bacterium]|jgi:ribonuclease BN (tRNA processing enzyme)|nr:MBL fold metallo-hydrolase [Bifidobacteriaceae bacterium]
MRLTIVGCSGSLAGPASSASSYLLQTRDKVGRLWSLVLDLGSGAFGPLQTLIQPEAVDAVALSHLHPDHCADLTGLAVYAKYRPGAVMDTLPVYGPADTARQLKAMQYSADPNSEGDLRVVPFQEGEPFQVGPMVATPYRVLHPVEAWGLRVVGPNSVRPGRTSVFAFSGDTDECPGLTKVAAGADLLLIEAAFQEGRDAFRGVHLTGLRAGRVASQAQAKRVVLTHLPPWNDPADTLQETEMAYAGPVHVARPRASYVF